MHVQPSWSELTEGDLPRAEDFAQFHPFIRGVFSQWHPTSLVIDGQTYCTAEQWMMASKATLFGDEQRASAILLTNDPAEQKRWGAEVLGFDQARWDAAKIGIVYRGNLEKFRQNAGALRQLLGTQPAMLVEANPRDWIWGVGRSVDDPRIGEPSHWRGTNLLGRILTRVRGDLA